MADAYWRYGDNRQQPPPTTAALHTQAVKRPRADFEMPSGQDLGNFYAPDDGRAGLGAARDTDSINASYDRYLRSAQQMPPHAGDSGRPDPRAMIMGGPDPALAAKMRPIGLERPPILQLPPDASSTLFVEGLPANCTRREVSHIFRPFVGYKEVRLVTKESRYPGGDPLVLCFVDFQSPAHAATALDALHGYIFDEHDRDSNSLRLQFARYPGARSGGGNRGKR